MERYRYLDEIDLICKIKNNTKVLDVGSGISAVLHFINGERFGIDVLADEYKKYSYPERLILKRALAKKFLLQKNILTLYFFQIY